MDISAAVKFTWSYLTADKSAGAGKSLAYDLELWWNEGEPLKEAVKRLFDLGELLVGLAVDIASGVTITFTNFVVSIVNALFKPSGGHVDGVEGGEQNTIGGAIASLVFKLLSLPLTLVDYFGNRKSLDISLADFVLYLVGWENATLGDLTAAGNTFFNETIPAWIESQFGAQSFIDRLYQIGNSFRTTLHQILFGEDLTPIKIGIDLEVQEPTTFGELPEASSFQEAAERTATSLATITSPGAPGAGATIHTLPFRDYDFEKAQRDVEAEERGLANLRNIQRIEAAPPVYIPPSPVRGLIEQITGLLQSVHTGIREFLRTNPNLFNIDHILTTIHQSLGGEGDITLLGIFDSLTATVEEFASDPGAFINNKLTGFRIGLLAWAEDKENPIVQAIDAFGQHISGDENWDIAEQIANVFTGIDAIGRSIRIAFGTASARDFIDEGYTQFEAHLLARNQANKSIFQVIIGGLTDLRDSVLGYLANPDNADNFSLINSFIQFLTGDEKLTVTSIADEALKAIEENGEEEGGSILTPQQTKFFDSLSNSLFGVNSDAAIDHIVKTVTGWPGRLINLIENRKETPITAKSLLQAVFNDPYLEPEDLIPNLIKGILGIPGAIIKALAQTEDFGVTGLVDVGPLYVPPVEFQEGESKNLANEVSRIQGLSYEEALQEVGTVNPYRPPSLSDLRGQLLADRGKAVKEGIQSYNDYLDREQAAFDDALAPEVGPFGGTGSIFDQRKTIGVRQFSLTPLLTRVRNQLNTGINEFFTLNPLGTGIVDAIRWVSGDKDFTIDQLGKAIGFLITNRNKPEKNAQYIQEYLNDHPNLFGLDSIGKFVTGDNEFSLAKLFPSVVKFFSGESGPGTLSGEFQALIDSVTGVVRAGEVGGAAFGIDPNTVIGNRGNIFQRIATAVVTSFQDTIKNIRDFFAKHEYDESGDLTDAFGLNNIVMALTGKSTITEALSGWIDSWNTEVEGADVEGEAKKLTLPEHINNFLTALTNLTTGEVEGEGEVNFENSPIGQFFSGLVYQFDSTKEDSVAGRLTQFGDAMNKLFTETLPLAVKTFETTINALERAIFSLQSAAPSIFGAPSTESIIKFGLKDALSALEGGFEGAEINQLFNLTGILNRLKLDPNDPLVLAELERLGGEAGIVGTLLLQYAADGLEDKATSTVRDEAETYELMETLLADADLSDEELTALLASLQTAYTTYGTDAREAIEKAFINSLTPPTDAELLEEGGGFRDFAAGYLGGLGGLPSEPEAPSEPADLFSSLLDHYLTPADDETVQSRIEAQASLFVNQNLPTVQDAFELAMSEYPAPLVPKAAPGTAWSFAPLLYDYLESDLDGIDALPEGVAMKVREKIESLIADMLNNAYAEPDDSPHDFADGPGPAVTIAEDDQWLFNIFSGLTYLSVPAIEELLANPVIRSNVVRLAQELAIRNNAIQDEIFRQSRITQSTDSDADRKFTGGISNYGGFGYPGYVKQGYQDSWMVNILSDALDVPAITIAELLADPNFRSVIEQAAQNVNNMQPEIRAEILARAKQLTGQATGSSYVDVYTKTADDSWMIDILSDALDVPAVTIAELLADPTIAVRLGNAARWLRNKQKEMQIEIARLAAHTEEGSGNAGTGDSSLGVGWGKAIIGSMLDGIELGASDFKETDIPDFIARFKPSSAPQEGPFSQIDRWGNQIGLVFHDGFMEGVQGNNVDGSVVSTQDVRLQAWLVDKFGHGDGEDGEYDSVLQQAGRSIGEQVAGDIQAGVLDGMGDPSSLLNDWASGYAEDKADIGDMPALSDLSYTGGQGVGQSWVDGFSNAFDNFFNEADEDEDKIGLESILESLFTKTQEFAVKLPTAFDGLPGALWDGVGDPMIKVFNVIIDRYNDMLYQIEQSTQTVEAQLGGITPIAHIPRAGNVSEDRPGFLGAQTGGVFGPGGLIVGERGPELIVPAQQIAVYPSQATRNLQQMRAMLQGQYQRPIYSTTNNNYNTYNQDDHTMNVTIQGGGTSADLMMRLRANQMRQR